MCIEIRSAQYPFSQVEFDCAVALFQRLKAEKTRNLQNFVAKNVVASASLSDVSSLAGELLGAGGSVAAASGVTASSVSRLDFVSSSAAPLPLTSHKSISSSTAHVNKGRSSIGSGFVDFSSAASKIAVFHSTPSVRSDTSSVQSSVVSGSSRNSDGSEYLPSSKTKSPKSDKKKVW